MDPTTIGSYALIRELGRGGMGVVYLATDTRLDRQVAIKALPPHLASNRDRLTRLQREAKVLASLNHPNIAAIYGLEQADGREYLVLEFIEGETLATRLAQRPGSTIPVNEALMTARQIAEALEIAHEKGIVHRDLKPGNVMVTPDGLVKVLDFGLARITADSDPAPLADAPTITSPARIDSPTIPGDIMGTAGYMSPEQARGKPVDKRSDIFSFGCVLYEMLTGAGPFPGETVTDSLGAILHREPDWTQLPSNTPNRIRDLLSSCLTKDRKNRLHDIGDARLEIDRAMSRGESTDSDNMFPVRQRNVGARLTAAIFCAMSLVAATWFLAARVASPVGLPLKSVRLVIASQNPSYAEANDAAISPDGRSIVFSARPVDQFTRCLWIRPIDSFDARALSETDGARRPIWSPDSLSIAFFLDGKLWAIEVSQASARRLVAADSPGLGGAAWGPDGSIIFSNLQGTSPLMRVASGGGGGGGSPQPLTTIDAASTEKGHVFPQFLPDGQHYLFVGVQIDPAVPVRQGRLYAGRIGSTERVFIANIISRVWYVEPGWLVYVDDGAVKAVRFDARALKLTGEAITVADGVRYFRGYGSTSLTASRDGTLAYQPPRTDDELVWFDLTGKRLGTIGPSGRLHDPRFSPDGSMVAVTIADRRTEYSDIWLFGIVRSTTVHLTSDPRGEETPMWSRDGSRIYYSADRATQLGIVSMRADGSGSIDEFYAPADDGVIWRAMDMAPDGKSIIAQGFVDKRGLELRIVPVDESEGKREAVPFRSTPAFEAVARFSPDGRWVAYVSNESGRAEIYLSSFPERGPKVQVSEDGGTNPMWSPDGSKIYYTRVTGDAVKNSTITGRAMMAVDLDSAQAFDAPPKARVLFETPDEIGGADIAPDGKRFLIICSPRQTPPIHVVLNAIPARP
jgi:serine/threonine protein kinase/Tol biopolymer transport system component